MQNIKKEELMKNRSYGGVLSAAFKLLGNNFKQIFRHIWACALALSAANALYVVFLIQSVGMPQSPVQGILTCGLLVLVMIAEIIFYGRAAMLINGMEMKWNIIRTTKLMLWTLAISIMVGIISGLVIALFDVSSAPAPTGIAPDQPQEIPWSMYAFVFVIIAIIILMLLPFLYISMKYYMEPDSHFRKLIFSGYKTGIRHFGFILVTVVITAICMAGISCVLSLPFITAMTAAVLSQAGIINGDEPGIPGYFHWMVYAVTLVSCFVYTFVCLFVLFTGYYIYGSIETKEKEKKEMDITNIKE